MNIQQAAERRKLYIGMTVGSYKIIKDCTQQEKRETAKFLVECCSCGNRTIKGLQELNKKKTDRCKSCPPKYQFEIKNGIAKCRLPDGSDLIIDEEDVCKIRDYYWWDNGVGYVLTRDRKTKEKIQIHRFILGLTKDSHITVDHINRNKHDNRKSNLRLVTQHQNAMNNPMKKNNSTGFTGVWYDKSAEKFCAKIMYKYKGIALGRSFDPKECAQMYNYAAKLLFGDFRGYKNDVPVPSEPLKRKVEERCHPYLTDALETTQPCGLFLCNRIREDVAVIQNC